jgi:cell wall-associated NlpC family hydrolase
MSPLHNARTTARRGVTALVVTAGLVLGATVLVPTAGADEVGDKRAEAAKVADQLDALQARQMELGAQAERVAYEKDQAKKAVDAAQRLLDQTNAELEKRRGDVRKWAVDAYQDGNDSPELDAFLTSDANTAVQKKVLLEAGAGNLRDAIDALGSAQQQAEDDKARLEEAQVAVDAKAAELAELKAANDKSVADAAALNSRVQGELQTLVAAEQARRAAEEQAATDRAVAAAEAAAATTGARSTAGATTGTGTTGSGGGGGVVAPSNPNPPQLSSGAAGAVQAAMSKNGSRPYIWGASGPTAFDCSGLVLWAFAQVGISLPHYSGAQYNATTRISRSQLQAGDLVFWGPGGSEHVAIYTGGGLIHAYGSGNGVNFTALEGWWKPPTGYGRVNG